MLALGLRLVLGRAGSGKTRLCLKEIQEALKQGAEGPAIIMITPEQATLQMELDLHRAINCPGFSRVQVLSFRRLGWRVFQETGGAVREHLGEMGKRMVLRALLNDHKDDLNLFDSLVSSPGFIEQLAHTIAELKLYRVEPEKLQKICEHYRNNGQGDIILSRKLHDISLIYSNLNKYLSGRYLDPDDYLSLIAERLPEADILKDAQVWIDGFNGFTPQEESILQALMKVAARVTVTLCLDSRVKDRKLGDTELFHPTNETYHRLRHLALSTGVDLEDEVLLTGTPPRFREAPVLAHIEGQIGRWPVKPYKGQVEGIRLISAANRRVEVEAAAREILRLAREEKLSWREIAVMVRDLEPYHDLIVNIFRDYNIPFFIDHRRPVGHHPLIELVRAALETVLENWAYDPVFRYLKSDLVPVSRHDIDLLENYVLAHGIHGSLWLNNSPWQFKSSRTIGLSDGEVLNDPELENINRIREQASCHLARFYHSIKNKSLTVNKITEALFSLLQELKVPEQLTSWYNEAFSSGDLDAAQEHEQVWNGFMDLLDELVVSLGDTPMNLDEYANILDAGMESLKLRLIPPAMDQVIVGTLDRSRQPELQAAFVLGIGEGVFPARIPEDATFNDKEREELKDTGLELAPSSTLRLFHEEFLIYLALTRSRRFLWLSYPLADAEGKALAPSPLVRQLRQLLPGINEENVGLTLPGGLADLDFLTTPRKAAGYLSCFLSKQESLPSLWQEVYRWLCQFKDKDNLLPLLEGSNYCNDISCIKDSLVQSLYSRPLRCSISQLETFASCPFRYFLTYGLNLRDRNIYQVDPASMGQFYHAALKLFVEELEETNLDWGELSDSQADAKIHQIVEQLSSQLQHEILNSSARYVYLQRKLERTLKRSIKILNEHARRGEFRPLAVEAYFGTKGKLPPLILNLDNNYQVYLEGQIDRIDVTFHKGKPYLRVIDYKSSTTLLDVEDIYHGLSLQLPLYLQAALKASGILLGKEAEPAGIFYFGVKDHILRENGPVSEEKVEKLHNQALKMRGLILAEPEIVKLMDKSIETNSDLLPVKINKNGKFHKQSSVADREQLQVLLDFARRKAEEMATAILAGRVEISPYRNDKNFSCRFCSYHAVCGFDFQLPGYKYRRLNKVNKNDFWELAAAAVKEVEADDN
ncbi:MAG: ATP-dependent helicase/nuclease subunit [Clostridia bacterium]|nr:ATP-dependent helicase/nuclease subunit [Clostridia bacterium]